MTQILPLKIYLECSKNLYFENNTFIFKNYFFYAGDSIKFKLNIPNTEFNCKYFFQKIYLTDDENNEVEKPNIIYNGKDDEIKLKFPSIKEENKLKKISGYINFLISGSLKLSIKLNNMIKKFDFVFASYDIDTKRYSEYYYYLYYDEDNDDNNTQTIHFHIEFLTNYKKERKIQIIIPKNERKDELKFKLIGKNNIIKTKETGISFYISITNISKYLKGDNIIKVIIDEFATAQIEGWIMDLPKYAYNKQTKKIEKYDKSKINQFDTNIFITPFNHEIRNYKNIVKYKTKIKYDYYDILFSTTLKNNYFLSSIINYFREKKEVGELFFQTRIFNELYWIPIWINLGQFKEKPKILDVKESSIQK